MKTATEILSMRMAICYTLYDKESANGLEIKTAIEEFTGRHIGDPVFYPVLADLVESEILQKDNLNPTHDRYQLSEEGEALLLDHHDWFSGCLDDSTGQQKLS